MNALSNTTPAVSIIIPVYNREVFTDICLKYLIESINGLNCEIILIDNGSEKSLDGVLNKYKVRVKTIRNDNNQAFAPACNQGAQKASGQILVFLNNATVPQQGWLPALTGVLAKCPDVGVVGSKLLYPDDLVQHAGVIFSHTRYPYNIFEGIHKDHSAVNKTREFSAVSGACLCVSKKDFNAVKGFDKLYVNGMEDIDLCLRVKAYLKKKVIYNPNSILTHFSKRSHGVDLHSEDNFHTLLSKWSGILEPDDYAYYQEEGFEVVVNGDGVNKLTYLTSGDFQQKTLENQQETVTLLESGRPMDALTALKQFLSVYKYYELGLTTCIKLSRKLGADATSYQSIYNSLINMKQLLSAWGANGSVIKS